MDWSRLDLFNKRIPLTPFLRGNHISASFKHELGSKIFELQKYQVDDQVRGLPLFKGESHHLQFMDFF